MSRRSSHVGQRQDPLRARFRTRPEDAWITDHAQADHSAPDDPFHGNLVLGDPATPLATGIHRAVGGDHDAPNPGDLLCGALAACRSGTIRRVAERMGLPVQRLSVGVTAEADVRGTLAVGPRVPVGFQRLTARVGITVPAGTAQALVDRLREQAEHCCVVLQTLRGGGTDLRSQWTVSADEPQRSPARHAG